MWLKWKMQINKYNCYEYEWLNMYECQSHRISNFQAFDQFIPAVWATSYSLQNWLMPSPPGTNPEGTCTTKRRLWLGCETRWFQWSAELGKCRCKTSWNMTWGTAKWLQTSMLDFFYRKLIMVVSRIRFHMVDTCCLSVISFRLQTKDTIEKTGCEGEAMWSSWTHTVLAFLFTFHDVKWSLGTVMTKSSKFMSQQQRHETERTERTETTTYCTHLKLQTQTLDLVQISLISTLPLGQLKVCFFGAKTNKGQTNHDTIILLISAFLLRLFRSFSYLSSCPSSLEVVFNRHLHREA